MLEVNASVEITMFAGRTSIATVILARLNPAIVITRRKTRALIKARVFAVGLSSVAGRMQSYVIPRQGFVPRNRILARTRKKTPVIQVLARVAQVPSVALPVRSYAMQPRPEVAAPHQQWTAATQVEV
jgi:hypothetical protein